MSTFLYNGNSEVKSIFNLIGEKENDITKAIIWILSECPQVLHVFLTENCEIQTYGNNITILYQTFEKVEDENSFTDIEITDNETFHIIIEAKRGWILPGAYQLTKYSEKKSFSSTCIPNKKIFSLSGCSSEYSDKYLPFRETPNGIPVRHISWKQLKETCDKAITGSNNYQKRLIREFLTYLGGIMGTPNINSNSVYVVALNWNSVCTQGYNFVDVVRIANRYYCPVDRFRDVNCIPNYIGFRFDGVLKYVCHIDSYVITRNLKEEVPFMDDVEEKCDYYVFRLGTKIEPSKTVKTGGVWPNGHNWADIDLLLTCDSVKEACDLSKKRRE